MSTSQAPLSPFLQYRPQLTSVLSITHRGTGVLLSIGAVLLSVWLASVAAGAETYHAVAAQLNAWYGRALIIGFIFSLYYHLCNGIRHLCWDLGLGLDLRAAYRSGYATLGAAALMTCATVWLGMLR